MPLRAIINNEDVLAPFLDDEAWEALKIRVKHDQLDVHVPCCGSLAYLRTSKHGIHHFVHQERDTYCPARQMHVYEDKLKAGGKDITVHWFDLHIAC